MAKGSSGKTHGNSHFGTIKHTGGPSMGVGASMGGRKSGRKSSKRG